MDPQNSAKKGQPTLAVSERGWVLKAAPYFAGLDSRELGLVESSLHRVSLPRDEMALWEGQPSDRLYFVAQGRMKVFKTSAEGREQILHVLGPGEAVAEAACGAGIGVPATTYPASAQALARTTVVFFPREDFARLLASRPGLALNLIAALAQKLREFAGLIEQLSLASIRARLAQYLLNRQELLQPGRAGWVHLGVSKRALASRLGTVPETLSRSLAALVRDGVVALDGRRVHVLDPEALREIASGLSE